MIAFSGCLIVFAVLVGHVGLHLAIYNRLNSTGLPRRRIKQIEKFFFVAMLVIPPIAYFQYSDTINSVVHGTWQTSAIPVVLFGYSVVCLGAWIVFGIPWLLWRPIFRLEWVNAPRTITYHNVKLKTGVALARTKLCELESRIPCNQIFDLSVERIQLPVAGLPDELVGYRIAHLSDIHLTGHIDPEYMAFVIKQANLWKPDMFAMTGDIIDKHPCVAWLNDMFNKASAPDGCYYILGNHDTRIMDPDETRAELNRAGWIDLGATAVTHRIRGLDVEIIGNEYPWFPRPEIKREAHGAFRLLLSHSPDQLAWARRHGVQLMLAGHTHGGQGRLPLVGPLMSPSYHGSRYASGDFYKPPTTLHVTRGLSGVHLLRLWCPPELSLIELQHKPSLT
jgi:uncharacterized protein